MDRQCSKCNGIMESETHPIKKTVAPPIPFAPEIPVKQYLPDLVKKYSMFTISVCDNCGYLELFLKWLYPSVNSITNELKSYDAFLNSTYLNNYYNLKKDLKKTLNSYVKT